MSWLHKIAKSEDLLFHGTGEPIEGDIAPRSWGGILWVAETPDIAQNYIPATGSSVLASFPEYQSKWRFTPDQGFHSEILEQMGFRVADMDVQYDHTGHATSYRILPNHPTYGEVRNYVENVLGYTPRYPPDGFMIKIHDGKFVPADFKAPGTLYIFTGKSKLKLLDLASGGEDDMMDPTYNKIGTFEKAKAEGYDGVRINDFAQSKNWGNMRHVSIGLFESGLAKLQQDKVEARNFDWGDDLGPIDTEEFLAWQKKVQGVSRMNWFQKSAKAIQLTPEIDGIIQQIVQKWSDIVERNSSRAYPLSFIPSSTVEIQNPYTQQPQKIRVVPTPAQMGSFFRSKQEESTGLDTVYVYPPIDNNNLLDLDELRMTLWHEFVHAIDPKTQLSEDTHQWAKSRSLGPDPVYYQHPKEIDAWTTELFEYIDWDDPQLVTWFKHPVFRRGKVPRSLVSYLTMLNVFHKNPVIWRRFVQRFWAEYQRRKA